MELYTALDEFELLERRRRQGEEGRIRATALAALREYLVDFSGFETTEALAPADLLEFLLDYYPSQETPEPEVARVLLDVAAEFALWLAERGERSLAPFAAEAARLRRELPRALEALALLQEHTRREDLCAPVLATDEQTEAPVGVLSSGLDRIARLDAIDYAAAETDRYTVRSVEPGAVALHSAAREALGEGPAAPVRIPLEAAKRLRPGDTIHAEIAPGPDGWELLEVFGIRPRGTE